MRSAYAQPIADRRTRVRAHTVGSLHPVVRHAVWAAAIVRGVKSTARRMATGSEVRNRTTDL